MDAMQTLHFTLFVLLCCQFGVSYRIYILPEPGAFCLGVFSGDDCITWSEYSARPKYADHSTTLIFTPGIFRYSYSYGTLSVPNIKRFTMIGDGAQLQFRLSFSNIGEVRMHNLTLTNSPRIDVRNVQSFMMENCTLSQTSVSTYSYYPTVGMYFYHSNLSRIINSTFIKVIIDVQSYSILLVETSAFMNSSQATAIKGDAYSSVTIHSSRFFNNFATSYGVVYTRGPLEVGDCLFDGNSVQSSEGAIVYSVDDVTITDSRFIRNNASYLHYYYRYNPQYYHYSYYRGGSAIRGQGNINIYNCTFSFYTQTSSVIYSYCYNRYQYYYDNPCNQDEPYQLHVANSKFYHSSRSIYSSNNVTIEDSSFSNIIAGSGDGGVVYSTKSVTITNCAFINNTAISGNGGVIYSQQWISIFDSVLINSLAQSGNGGGIYSENDVKAINCTISECSAPNGTGGAIYSAARDSGAIFAPNIVLSKSTFSHNSAECGGVLYTNGHYDHHMEFTDSTFIFNEATGTNTTGGGVGCVGNTTLSIKNSVFNNNMAETVGGVLDLSFSKVTIEHSSFSQNSADDNGGVFHGQNYSTNFTIAHTVMDHNSAGNGGVFYVRRSNSNIKIIDSKLILNSASNQGGVMDIRGVTLTMDADTVIANNTAGSSGNVISACVSKIIANGLEARLDPVYPLYCSIYDEGMSFRPHPMSQTISTDDSATMFTTEQNLIETTSHDGNTESVTMSVSERGTTNEEMTITTSFSSTARSTSAATFTSDSPGALPTHSPYEATTSSPSAITSRLPSDNDATTTESNTQPPTMIASTETQSYTDEVTTISVDATTPASVNQETSSSPIASTSDADNEGSTIMPTEFNITTATATTTSKTDSPTYFSQSKVTTVDAESKVTTDLDRFAVLQVEQDKYDIWKNSQHNLLQVAIISLMVLCMVCIAVCFMMITLFFMACKRRKGLRLITRARYKKLSPIDKDQEESKPENEMEEYSFSEI